MPCSETSSGLKCGCVQRIEVRTITSYSQVLISFKLNISFLPEIRQISLSVIVFRINILKSSFQYLFFDQKITIVNFLHAHTNLISYFVSKSVMKYDFIRFFVCFWYSKITLVMSFKVLNFPLHHIIF